MKMAFLLYVLSLSAEHTSRELIFESKYILILYSGESRTVYYHDVDTDVECFDRYGRSFSYKVESSMFLYHMFENVHLSCYEGGLTYQPF